MATRAPEAPAIPAQAVATEGARDWIGYAVLVVAVVVAVLV